MTDETQIPEQEPYLPTELVIVISDNEESVEQVKIVNEGNLPFEVTFVDSGKEPEKALELGAGGTPLTVLMKGDKAIGSVVGVVDAYRLNLLKTYS